MSNLSSDAKAFLADIEAVCRKHKMWLGEHDEHGCLLVIRFQDDRHMELNIKRLHDQAFDGIASLF